MYMYGDSIIVQVIAANKDTSQVDFKIVNGDNNDQETKKIKG